jgi:hypothetical protein
MPLTVSHKEKTPFTTFAFSKHSAIDNPIITSFTSFVKIYAFYYLYVGEHFQLAIKIKAKPNLLTTCSQKYSTIASDLMIYTL